MFDKILIANRGEIACRIIRTCRRLGVRTVAVYSSADPRAWHVALADEAVLLGPPPARQSYLSIERIIAAAKGTGARAIHPGYGFLSERAEFAEACAAAGLVFIGPPVQAIRAMGLKGAAKVLMAAAGVPVVPGYHGDDQSPAWLAEQAQAIGFPLLIKAVAGGGGKGMRRADGDDDFGPALEAAMREAMSAFGDDRVLLEKLIERPRHIELQVFGDSHGGVVHLFERDCSVQRRHQKVIEEAPAPGMTREMRAAMGRAAVTAARAIGYVGAGTVEFIADVSDGLRADRYWFMEMNTRLQVEHPVTEAITGLDLVEWQLRVAAGERLPRTQEQLAIDGHAIEARIYAEDADHDFLPSTGRLLRLREPQQGEGVRVDSGVREGDEVTIHYDPLLAKLIAHGATRDVAAARLHAALAQYEVAGLVANTEFLARLVAHPAFLAGELDTGFIARHRAELLPEPTPADDPCLALAALELLLSREEAMQVAAARSRDPHSPWNRLDGWRACARADDALKIIDGARELTIAVRYEGDGWRLELPGGSVQAHAERRADGGLSAWFDGRALHAVAVSDGEHLTVIHAGRSRRLKLHDPMHQLSTEEETAGVVTAPMPGKVIQLLAREGERVRRGQPVLVLEAMKMELTLRAPGDGVIEGLRVGAGDQVAANALLFELTEK